MYRRNNNCKHKKIIEKMICFHEKQREINKVTIDPVTDTTHASSVTGQQTDPHHCYCFQINSLNYETISKMKQTGFKKQILEEYHGQVFSTTKRIDEHTQIHFKVLQDGTIESEMEYPPDYPIAHLNSIHSYSAHKETEIILNHFSIQHKIKKILPITCIQRKIVKAVKPSHWTTILGALIVVVISVGAIYVVSKSKN